MRALSVFIVVLSFASTLFAEGVEGQPSQYPDSIVVKTSGVDKLGGEEINFIFKHERKVSGGVDNYWDDGVFNLKKGFFGPTDDWFGDNISIYGGYLMIDLDSMEVWEGTQAQSGATPRGKLRLLSDGSYELYDTVDINHVVGDGYICVGRSSSDECR